MKKVLLIILSLPLVSFAHIYIDEVKVFKSQHEMHLMQNGRVIKKYKVMLGSGGMGPKRQEGDRLVPEGRYILDEKNPQSKYHLSIHINYPSEHDRERAKRDGVNPGGDVFIHGLPNQQSKLVNWLRSQLVKVKNKNKLKIIQKKLDWTKGCIAVSDIEMDELYKNLDLPLPISIYP